MPGSPQAAGSKPGPPTRGSTPCATLLPISAATGAHGQPDSPGPWQRGTCPAQASGPPTSWQISTGTPGRSWASAAVLGVGVGSEAVAPSSLPKQGSACLPAALSTGLCLILVLSCTGLAPKGLNALMGGSSEMCPRVTPLTSHLPGAGQLTPLPHSKCLGKCGEGSPSPLDVLARSIQQPGRG